MVLVIDEKLGCQITEMELNTTHRAVRSRCGNRTRAPQEEGARTRTPERGCARPGGATQLLFASMKRTFASGDAKAMPRRNLRLLRQSIQETHPPSALMSIAEQPCGGPLCSVVCSRGAGVGVQRAQPSRVGDAHVCEDEGEPRGNTKPNNRTYTTY